MANSLATNPKVLDTTGATSAIETKVDVMLIQWVDDNADIADNANLIMVINGATVEITLQRAATVADGITVLYEAAFPGGFSMSNFYLTTMTAGNVLIWTK